MDDLEALAPAECIALLASGVIGRIGAVVDAKPFVLPVNYRFLEQGGRYYIAFRTRPNNVIDRAGELVAFEIDGADHARHSGWSVLVRGHLYHLGDQPGSAELLDSAPWITHDRQSWLVIVVHEISGRRIAGPEVEWAFHLAGYR